MRSLPCPAVATALLLLAACSPSVAREGGAGTPLPAGWATSSPALFESQLEAAFPDDDRARPLADAGLQALEEALRLPEPGAGPDGELEPRPADDVRRALRAVLLLTRSGDPRGPDLLLAQLNARRRHPGRPDDAADCLAAAAFAGRIDDPRAAEYAAALSALADGDVPHPDLEVRTECAVAALALGERAVVPFLLRVARIGTPSAERAGRLTDSPTTAWVRGRSIDALRGLLDRPFEPFTDLSATEREAVVDELERELLPR